MGGASNRGAFNWSFTVCRAFDCFLCLSQRVLSVNDRHDSRRGGVDARNGIPRPAAFAERWHSIRFAYSTLNCENGHPKRKRTLTPKTSGWAALVAADAANGDYLYLADNPYVMASRVPTFMVDTLFKVERKSRNFMFKLNVCTG